MVELESCDILLFKGNDFYSRAIRLATLSKYSHVGILIKADEYNTVGEALASGFMIHDYGINLKYMIENNVVDVYRYEGLTPEQKEAIIKYTLSKKGVAYDWINIFQIAIFNWTGLKVLRDDPEKLICTEATIRAFNRAGIRLLPNIPMYSVEPGDIGDCDQLRKII